MNPIINVLDKNFVLYIEEQKIMDSISVLAEKINIDYRGRTPFVISVLNGAFMFTSDLLKMLDSMCKLTFIKVASYDGEFSSGNLNKIIGLNDDISGEDIIIIDDIADSGFTLEFLKREILALNPKSLKTCVLVEKPNSITADIKVDYSAMKMLDNPFIIGYGLDYNGYGRNLRDIYILENNDR